MQAGGSGAPVLRERSQSHHSVESENRQETYRERKSEGEMGTSGQEIPKKAFHLIAPGKSLSRQFTHSDLFILTFF